MISSVHILGHYVTCAVKQDTNITKQDFSALRKWATYGRAPENCKTLPMHVIDSYISPSISVDGLKQCWCKLGYSLLVLQ